MQQRRPWLPSVARRNFLGLLPCLACCVLPACNAAPVDSAPHANVPVACGWPAWEAFRNKFVQADGRVIDFAADAHSTSEGQAYAMFFALVADDRAAFALLLRWTRANLAGGDLTARMMAWKWGKRADGSWGVIDANAASDADLWLAYILFQAGREWGDDSLRATAQLMQARIEREVVIHAPGIGPVLLPGPQGFGLKSGGWKLNPSYLPLPLLQGLQREAPMGPWLALARTSVAMLEAVTPQRLAPDWIALRPGRGFVLDPETGLGGSYDAIRVYLWAGMMSPHDPLRARVLARLSGMRGLAAKQLMPPEKIDAASGQASGAGPVGFSAALLPFFAAIGDTAASERQRNRITAAGGIPAVYFEQALGLFALGWMEQRFHFQRDGRLALAKTLLCKK
jgi:endoglucanase